MPHRHLSPRIVRLGALCAVLASLAACTSVSLTRAPVVERSTQKPPVAASAPAPAPAASTPEAKPASGAENAGKPGYYTVKQGDTLLRIALDNGQNWRDLARWNGIDDPNHIEVGQVLHVQAPTDAAVASSNGVVTRPVTASGKLDVKPTDSGKPGGAASGATAAASGSASGPTALATVAPPARESGEDEPSWAWPAKGALLSGFDDQRSKGFDIGGKKGDPVYAAADGRVVYAGSNLRGYGNLVIIKHNASYLTVYAHNESLLVKEDEAVRKGQKIAEMGNTDADQVELHFEVRKQGKPVDPAKFLPAR